MGDQRIERKAIDSDGNQVLVVEWRGDHGTAHMHDDADLKDPQFYSHYTLSDDVTKLVVQPDKRILLQPDTGKLYTLQQ